MQNLTQNNIRIDHAEKLGMVFRVMNTDHAHPPMNYTYQMIKAKVTLKHAQVFKQGFR
jgi:hypothetical protein